MYVVYYSLKSILGDDKIAQIVSCKQPKVRYLKVVTQTKSNDVTQHPTRWRGNNRLGNGISSFKEQQLAQWLEAHSQATAGCASMTFSISKKSLTIFLPT